MKKIACLCLMMLFVLFGCESDKKIDTEETTKLRILTEDYPPLNFRANGEITGQATEVVRELIRKTGTGDEITMIDWQEGYQAVLEQPDTAMFSMVMTPKRKDLFQWAGPINVLDTNLYAAAGSEIRAASLDDARKVNGIATVAGYYSEQVLKDEQDFTNLRSYPDETSALRALLDGEVELLASNNTVIPAILENLGVSMDELESVFTISTDMSYIAFSKKTSPLLVAKWQEKLDEMKDEGSFEKIYSSWLPADTPPGKIQLVTEEYPPVTFMRDGKPAGFVTDMVREITARLDIPDNISLTSWKNAYNMALLHPNIIIFSMDRTEAREDLFQWVGPVGQNSALLFARKGSGISIGSMEEARNVDSIATTTDWWTEQHLKAAGFTNLISSPEPGENVRQLMEGSVELSIFTDVTIPEIVRSAGYGMDELEPVFTVEQNYFYIGISKGTSPEMVEKWQSTLDNMKNDGTFEEIYRNYLPHADLDNLLRK
jgi:polar amino acid transport system substrate-binding protein